tara:strand:+ start:424 stop:636 length:213 start_codon:yes stop_codon:yes gene_type:complete
VIKDSLSVLLRCGNAFCINVPFIQLLKAFLSTDVEIMRGQLIHSCVIVTVVIMNSCIVKVNDKDHSIEWS